jgi:outer membrane protein
MTAASRSTRKHILSHLIIFSLMFFWGTGLASAEPAPVLSIEQAVALALVHNQDLRIAGNQVRDGEVAVRLQRDQFLPGLTADGGGALRHDQGASGKYRDYGTLTADLNLSLNLFNGFGDQAALEEARQALAARRHSFTREEQSLLFTTIDNYLQAVKALEQIGVAEQDLKDNETQLADIEAYHKAGSRPITDVYLQQAETARARSTLLAARRDYQVNKLALLQTIGVNATAELEVVMPDNKLLEIAPDTDPAKLVAAALSLRPDLQARQKEVAAAKEQVRVAKAGGYPSLDLVASAGSGFDGRNDEVFGSQMGEDNFQAAVGLSLFIPIFDRNLSRHQTSQALIASDSARLEVSKLQRQIEAEIGQAVADYCTADALLETARAQLSYAEDALASTEKRYQVGAATLTELTSARSVYVEARYSLVEAEINRMVEAVAIVYYRGDLDAKQFYQKVNG